MRSARSTGRKRRFLIVQYLIDSDWAIDWLRGVPAVVTRLSQLARAELAMSAVSVGELYDGVYGATDPALAARQLEDLLSRVQVLPFDQSAARSFGQERQRLRAQGNLIGDNDLMIAATAIQHGLTLLSNNRQHFDRVDGLTLDPA